MGRYVAFLRGMNLGKRRIKNDELCECFSQLGFENVSAFLASGNVLFDTSLRSQPKLEKTIAAGLEDALEYPVPTFLRGALAVEKLALCVPFSDEELQGTTSNIQVALLSTTPEPSAQKKLNSLCSDGDQLRIVESTLYWLPTKGLSDSGLDWKAVEKVVGPTTVRTQRTFVRLLKHL